MTGLWGSGVTPVGATVLLLAVALVASGRITWLLAAGLAAPFAAVFIVGTQGVTVWQFACLAAVAASLWARPHPGFSQPGRGALLAFWAWSAAVTVAGPVIFAGHRVLPPSAGAVELQFHHPRPLALSETNFTQVALLALAVAVVFAAARLGRLPVAVLGVGLGLAAILSTISFLHTKYGTPWVPGFLDSLPGVRYVDATPDGLRNRGIYSEPSALATGSLAAAVFAAMSLRSAGHAARFGWVLVILCSGYNLYTSDSTTAMVGGILGAAFLLAKATVDFLRGARTVAPSTMLLALAAVGVLAVYSGTLVGSVTDELGAKSLTTSFASRTGNDLFALQAMRDSYLVGVGFGSTRTFSLWATVLGGVGLVGAILFVRMLWVIFAAGWRVGYLAPVAATLGVAVLCTAVSGAPIVNPVVWTCIAVLASHLWTREVDGPVDAAGPRSRPRRSSQPGVVVGTTPR